MSWHITLFPLCSSLWFRDTGKAANCQILGEGVGAYYYEGTEPVRRAGIVTVSLFRSFGILQRDCPLSGGWGSAHCTNYRGNEVSLPRLEGLSNSREVLLSTSILPSEGGNVSVEQIHGACLAAMGDIASNSYPILPLTAQVDLPTPVNTGHRLLDAEERQAFERAWKGPRRHVGAQAFPRYQGWQPGHNTSPNYQRYPSVKPSNGLFFDGSRVQVSWSSGGCNVVARAFAKSCNPCGVKTSKVLGRSWRSTKSTSFSASRFLDARTSWHSTRI